jgi:histidine ammonia-lyase
VRPHAGQAATAAHVVRLLEGSARVRGAAARSPLGDGRAEPVQDPYTLRCVPQVLGAVRATIAHVREAVAIEVNAVGDNPTFFPEEDVVLHGGNFHGQPLALAVDHAKVALAEIALFSERRLARLLDPATNGGLPPFLIRDRAGTRSGLMGLRVLCQLERCRERGARTPGDPRLGSHQRQQPGRRPDGDGRRPPGPPHPRTTPAASSRSSSWPPPKPST